MQYHTRNKYSPKSNKKGQQVRKYKEKALTDYWQCKMCLGICPSEQGYCGHCYYSPYYYYYINNHLFVQRDQQINEAYKNFRKHSRSFSQQSQEQQKIQNKVQIVPNFRWITELLEDQ